MQYSLTMKDIDVPFGVPNNSSHGLFYQDFHHHVDPFHQVVNVNGNYSSSSNHQVFPTNLDSFDNFTYACNSSGFDVYECKPLVENNNNNNVHVMDNFQYGGGGGFSNLNLIVGNQNYLPFQPQQETKPINFVVPDEEVSSISTMSYYKNKLYPTSRKGHKLQKKSNIVKGQWTESEDSLLIQLVEQYGLRKWSHIAHMLPGRIGKQCRERWHNHLRPDIKKDTWTEEEDKILIEAHAEIGNKWAEIAKRLPGRTENSIKNHWNATKRRQYSKRKCRSKYPKASLLQEYIKSLNLDKNPPMDYRRKSVNPRGNANKIIRTTASKAPLPLSAVQPQPVTNNAQISMTDRLVPSYDFNELLPDFCFDENLFEGGCSIDSLLDDIPCAPIMDEKIMQLGDTTTTNNVVDVDDNNGLDCDDMQQEIMESMMEGDGIIKKEMDLVEVVSHNV